MKRRSLLSSFVLRPSPIAFTLVEMLVSMAVLALLVVLVAQLVNSANLTILSSGKHMDADSQARTIMDRLAVDIGKMVKRSDVDCIVKGSNSDAPNNTPVMAGNDALFFFSEAPGYSSTLTSAQKSSVCLVGYRINPISTPATSSVPSYALERLASAVGWTGLAFLTYATGSATPASGSSIGTGWSSIVGTSGGNYSDGTSADYQAVGSQVFRFEYCYLLKDGTLSNTPFIAPHTTVQGFQDVSAIVVAFAILDTTSRKIAGDLTQLSASLPDSNPPTLMAETWKNAITTPNFASNVGIPQLAAGQVRIYQRYFYLDNKKDTL